MIALLPLLAMLFSLPQEGEKTPEPPLQQTASDPAAVALLGDLVAAQRSRKELAPFEVFEMRIHVRDFAEQGAHEADVVLAYDAGRGNLLMSVADSARAGNRVDKGFDEQGYWLRKEGGELVDLGPREFLQDRDAIDASIDLCEDFLLLFDFERLQQRARSLRVEQSPAGQWLVGSLKRGRELWAFRLLVPTDRPLPERLWLQAPTPPPKQAEDGTEQPQPAPPPQLFSFGDYRDFGGRRLPGFIDQMRSFEPLDPLRSFEIQRFLWDDPSRVQTRRSAGPSSPPAEDTAQTRR